MRIIYNVLKRRDSKQLIEGYCGTYPRLCSNLNMCADSPVYEAVVEEVAVYVVDGVPIAFRFNIELLPTLVAVKLAGFESTHFAIVDEGAVKPILNGADVMAPGIVRVSNFTVGDVVVVWSPGEKSPIAVTKALMSSSDIMSMRRGRALRNIHRAGDTIWKISLEALKKFGRI